MDLRTALETEGLPRRRIVRLLLLELVREGKLRIEELALPAVDDGTQDEAALADAVLDAAEARLEPDRVRAVVDDWRERAEAESLESFASIHDTSFEDLAKRLRRFNDLPTERRRFTRSGAVGTRVAMTRAFISDQLEFVGVAKRFLRMSDFEWIAERTLGPSRGQGRIGGKAAGMMLGHRILRDAEERTGERRLRVKIPDSWFLRSDTIQRFLERNEFEEFQNQKYRDPENVREDYPVIRRLFRNAPFPEDVVEALEPLLRETAGQPLIVRSSSLLEDRFGAAFSGKYASIFLGNQGAPKDRLRALLAAIAEVYASTLAPMPILYRKRHNLIDYNEDMAVLIQRVVGSRHGKFFLPDVAGVAFSRNEYRWSPRILAEDGVARVVMGLGTRAVDRTGNDWSRIVPLGAPTLRPEVAQERIVRFSQRWVDVVDLETNGLRTIQLGELLDEGPDAPGLPLSASVLRDGTLREPASGWIGEPVQNLCLTFDRLVKRTPFASRLRKQLRLLEDAYGSPIDVEYAIVGGEPYLLQCRPQAIAGGYGLIRMPAHVPRERRLFYTREAVRSGEVRDIEFIVWVDPEAYLSMENSVRRAEVGRAVGRVNDALEGRKFLLIGPGRWGSNDPSLGVKVSYAEIGHCKALIEVARPHGGFVPEVSYGTHFFQELVEDDIFYLPLQPGEADATLNENRLRRSVNRLSVWVPRDRTFEDVLRVVAADELTDGAALHLAMDSETGEAICWHE